MRITTRRRILPVIGRKRSDDAGVVSETGVDGDKILDIEHQGVELFSASNS